MKKYLLLIIFILCFITTSVFAENHYINAACSSACDGSTWARGWASFGAVTWTRGDTYYVAGGTYNENITIPSKAGTDWITIKKANAADNGSDLGWDSSYATTQTVIDGNVTSFTGYVEIDGVTGSDTSGHGIKINPLTLVNVVTLANGTGPYHFYHLEIKGNGFAAGATGSDGIVYNIGIKGFHVSDCWIHEVTRNGVTIGSSVGTSYSDYGMLFENNFISETGGCSNPNIHGQGLQIGYNSTDSYLIIRNNTFRNIHGSAMIAYLGGASANHSQSLIYNNVFYITDLSTYSVISPGVIWTNNAGGAVTDYFYIYNNTYYGLGNSTYNGVYGRIHLTSSRPITTAEAKNNFWMSSYLPYGGYLTGVTSSSNNGFYNNNGSSSPGNTELADPFVDSTNYDFRLKSTASARGAAVNLSSIFTTDKDVNTRSAWDIGAYEYPIDPSPPPPPPPQPPLAPGNLSATASSPSQINLSWTDSSNNEDGFIIERCTDSSCTDSWLIAILVANVKTYSDTDLAANTTYYYRVRAYNSTGNSHYSNTASARTISASSLPAAPSNLTATASSSRQLKLSWTDNSNNETGFKIERCTGNSCSSFTQIASVAANVRTYINTGLNRNTTYTYPVSSYNSAGSSGYSNRASARTSRY